MKIDSETLRERLNDDSLINWIDKDKSPWHYKQGYLSGLIKALAVLGEVEHLTEHGEEREPIVLDFDEDAVEGLKAITGAVNDKLKELELLSHSEKNIVNGCIDLMEDVHQKITEFMDQEQREDIPVLRYTYFEIVKTLLLSGTSHGGGTSTRKKCAQLGIDSYEEFFIGEIEEE